MHNVFKAGLWLVLPAFLFITRYILLKGSLNFSTQSLCFRGLFNFLLETLIGFFFENFLLFFFYGLFGSYLANLLVNFLLSEHL
jgi:hypothetical protein